MTGKRFTLFEDGETIIDNESVADDGGKEVYWTVEYVQVVKLVKLLNDLHDENEQLKLKKDRYKKLSQIRYETINNRILTIREFINNCSDSKVKNTLKDLFYSEVNEYDLPKKYRELEHENEQLKEQNADWETSLDICKHYKEAYSTEIVKIKHTIKTMMENERTELGRSVLKQLWEAIQ